MSPTVKCGLAVVCSLLFLATFATADGGGIGVTNCVNNTLEKATQICNASFVPWVEKRISRGEFTVLCDNCLATVATLRSSCSAMKSVVLTMNVDCRVCNPRSTASECQVQKRVCYWNEESNRCMAYPQGGRKHAMRRKSGVAQGGAGAARAPKVPPTEAPAATVMASPTLSPGSCEGTLALLSGRVCSAVLTNACSGEGMIASQCPTLCGVCLSAVLAISGGSCNNFVRMQATFQAQCQVCNPTTAAPTLTFTVPALTAAPTVVVTEGPISGPECRSNLLAVSGSLCANIVSDVGSEQDVSQCQLMCALCLNAVMSVSGGNCSTFVSLQVSFHGYCSLCATSSPVPTAVPTTNAAATPTPTIVDTTAPTATPTEKPWKSRSNSYTYSHSRKSDGHSKSHTWVSKSHTRKPHTLAPATSTPTDAQGTGVPPQMLTPIPAGSCQSTLLQLSGKACATIVISNANDNDMEMSQCQLMCALCLNAVLSISGSACSPFIDLQASLSAQCAMCPTAAPVTTTTAILPTLTINTNAQNTPALTVIDTAPPTSTSSPTCAAVLLRLASAACHLDVTPLTTGDCDDERCATLCTSCLATILSVPTCECPEYEAAVATMSSRCASCLATRED